MNVIVDTSVWSLALRRSKVPSGTAVLELAELICEGRVVMLGLVRQELLSGIKDTKQFQSLRDHLLGFVGLPTETADHEEAAALSDCIWLASVHASLANLQSSAAVPT